jgi:hypothetical protein
MDKCFNCNKEVDHHYINCPMEYNSDAVNRNRNAYLATRNANGGSGGKGGERGGKGAGRGYSGHGGRGGQGDGRGVAATAAFRDMVAAVIANPSGTITAPSAAPALPPVVNMCETFFNNYINFTGVVEFEYTAKLSNVLSSITAASHAVSGRPPIVWLFDSDCANHIADSRLHFLFDPIEPTADMFNASGERMPISKAEMSTCGFHSKLITNYPFNLFFPRQAVVVDHWLLQYPNSNSDQHLVANPFNNQQFAFTNTEGFYLHLDFSARSPDEAINVAFPSQSLVQRINVPGPPPPPSTIKTVTPYVDDALVTMTNSNTYVLAAHHTDTMAKYMFLPWHQRLNHIGYTQLWNLISQGHLKGFPFNIKHVDIRRLDPCEVCGPFKAHHVTLSSTQLNSSHTRRPGMHFSVDMKIFSRSFFKGVNTLVVIADGYSKYK